MTAPVWKLTADGKHLECELHPKVAPFGRNRTCIECDAHPIALTMESAAAPPVETPDGCRTLQQHEALLTTIADEAVVEARMLCKKGKARINWSTAAKLYEIAIKATSAAAELTNTRERRAHVRHLKAQHTKLRGGGN